MTARTDLAAVVLAGLGTVPGLRPATPVLRGLLGTDPELLAVAVDDEEIEVRLVATALPVPPLLTAAEQAIRAGLAQTGWAQARLRLVVTEVDPCAFTGDKDHPIGA